MIKVLVFLPHYLPGEKSGGPAQSIANLVELLGDECSFSIVTSDHDLGSAIPYEDVAHGDWVTVGKARVTYLPESRLGVAGVRSVIRATPHDVLYLNGVFSHRFSIIPMMLRKMQLVPQRPVIIASRGEFSLGALALKPTKKWAFLSLARLIGLYQQPLMTWQASTVAETVDIRRVVDGRRIGVKARTNVVPNLVRGTDAHVVMASDVTALRLAGAPVALERKQAGQLSAVFLSRISPKKNLRGLLEALKGVAGDVRLTVFGPIEDASYWRECSDCIKELPPQISVNYGGVVPHSMVGPTMSRYQLLAFPTFGENFGHVIVEALMAACPVLTTDATPWADIDTTGAGSIVSATNTVSITAALQRHVDCDHDAWLRMSKAARALGERRAANPETIAHNRALFVNAAREAVA